jgi:hypothetical protein
MQRENAKQSNVDIEMENSQKVTIIDNFMKFLGNNEIKLKVDGMD